MRTNQANRLPSRRAKKKKSAQSGNGRAGVEAVELMGIRGRYFVSAPRDCLIPDALVGWNRVNSLIPLNNTGFAYANSELRVTSIAAGTSGIDPDGSTSTVNLVGVIKQLYLSYRVVGFKCTVTLQQQDPTGTQVWVGLTAARLSKNNSTNINFVLNKDFNEAYLPPANSAVAPTNSRCTWTTTVAGNLVTFNGTEQAYTDDNYQALTGGTGAASTPVNNVYLHVGAQGVGANLNSGVNVTCVWEQEIVFFERDPQVS